MTLEERQLELLGKLLDDPLFREWFWGHCEQQQPFVTVVPSSNAGRDAWLLGRKSVAIELVGTVINKYPLRYVAMVQSADAWRAQREAEKK